MSAPEFERVLGEHAPGGYFATADGHRECFCGHVLSDDETLRAHLAAALNAEVARWLADEAGPVNDDRRYVHDVLRELRAALAPTDTTADEGGWHEHDAAGCIECPCASSPMNSAPCTCPTADEGGAR